MSQHSLRAALAPTYAPTYAPTPRSDLHAPRPPARAVLSAAIPPSGGTDHTHDGAPIYWCRSGEHAWYDPRDARRCCNGFWQAAFVDALRGRFERWERDPDASHDACYVPRRGDRLDPHDPSNANTRTDVQAVILP